MTEQGVTAQIELEEKATKKRIAALKDVAFISGVRQALLEEQQGDAGVPWSEVKKELGITV